MSREAPPLPCPECRTAGIEGGARIGNRRSQCTICNNFAQAVRRLTLVRLRERHPADYEELRLRTEMDLYPQVIEQFTAIPKWDGIDPVDALAKKLRRE